jgi:hypothetical protein
MCSWRVALVAWGVERRADAALRDAGWCREHSLSLCLSLSHSLAHSLTRIHAIRRTRHSHPTPQPQRQAACLAAPPSPVSSISTPATRANRAGSASKRRKNASDSATGTSTMRLAAPVGPFDALGRCRRWISAPSASRWPSGGPVGVKGRGATEGTGWWHRACAPHGWAARLPTDCVDPALVHRISGTMPPSLLPGRGARACSGAVHLCSPARDGHGDTRRELSVGHRPPPARGAHPGCQCHQWS